MAEDPMTHVPGVALFEHPRAEYETAWLGSVFVPPQAYTDLLTMRSIAIFGEPGMGMSALQQALSEEAEAAGRMVVAWVPTLLDAARGTPAVLAYMRQVLESWSIALLRYVARHPDRFTLAPVWAQEALTGFLQTRLPGSWDYHLGQVATRSTPDGYDLLQRLRAHTPAPEFDPDSVDGYLIRELATLLAEIGISGTWIVVDGTQPWVRLSDDALVAMLNDIAATLTYFEMPGVAWRFLLPASFSTLMSQAAAVVRGRMERYTLQWSPSQLRRIVEQRLRAAFDREDMLLDDLGEGATMLAYLQQYGGSTPRGWLDLLRPFVAAYQAGDPPQPLTPCQWEQVRRGALPPLHLQPEGDRVMVGQRLIEELTPSLKRVLFYLHSRPGHRCSRSELYFVAYRGFDLDRYMAMSDEERDTIWEPVDGWGPVFDTVLWRLRKALEWNSRDPQYLLSERGATRAQGEVWLHNIL